MRAAEKLISERGIENVAIRDIVGAAGQKNESALQYHFGSLSGLLQAIGRERSAQIRAARSNLISRTLARTPEPTLREVCELMVRPVFDLARSQPDFRRYVKAFGHEIALDPDSALLTVTRQGAGGESGQQLADLLRRALPHLDNDAYRRRMEAAVRLNAISLYHQARQKNAFRGEAAELFYHSLIDALVGLLGAPESEDTKAAARRCAR